MRIHEIRQPAQKCRKGQRSQNDPSQPARFSPFLACSGPIFFDPGLRRNRRMRLHRRPQSALISSFNIHEAEGLPGGRDWTQHFHRAEYRAAIRYKQQLELRTLLEHVGQVEQAAIEGNHFKLPSVLPSIWQSQDGRCYISQVRARTAPLGVGVGHDRSLHQVCGTTVIGRK